MKLTPLGNKLLGGHAVHLADTMECSTGLLLLLPCKEATLGECMQGKEEKEMPTSGPGYVAKPVLGATQQGRRTRTRQGCPPTTDLSVVSSSQTARCSSWLPTQKQCMREQILVVLERPASQEPES